MGKKKGIMSNKTITKSVEIGLYLFAAAFFIITLLLENIQDMLPAVLILMLANVVWCLRKWKERYAFGFFFLSFFTFLLGKYVFGGMGDSFDNEIYMHIFRCLFISMLGLVIGGTLKESMLARRRPVRKQCVWNNFAFEKGAVLVAVFTFFLYILPILEKLYYVQTHSYVDYYLNFRTRIPSYISKWGEGFPIAFWTAMACFPNARTTKLLTCLYGFAAVVSLGTGQRNIFVLNVLILVLYFIARDQIGVDSRKWISRKLIFACIPLGIAGVLFLSWYAYRRNGMQSNASVVELFAEFFIAQGGSADLIGYGKLLEGDMPLHKYYSLGSVLSFLKNNAITNVFVQFPQYFNHTEEMALYGDNFGQTITYLVMPWNYYDGIGMGTCYIAEVYHDFRYIGVLVFNMLLGMLLRSFPDKSKRANPIVLGFFFVMLRQILYLPRDIATSFITDAFNLINLFTVTVILVAAGLIADSRRQIHVWAGEREYE